MNNNNNNTKIYNAHSQALSINRRHEMVHSGALVLRTVKK